MRISGSAELEVQGLHWRVGFRPTRLASNSSQEEPPLDRTADGSTTALLQGIESARAASDKATTHLHVIMD